MFQLLTGDIDANDPDLADRVYRFRHGFFVEHLKWEACRKPDGRERDAFDGADCLHVVGIEQDEIVAYARLLPTTRPHLQTHLYPEILQGGTAPTGPAIFEWTRHAVAPKKREVKGANLYSRAAFGAVAQAVRAMGLDGLLVQTHPVLVERLMDMGWDCEPLALPYMYEGALLLPIYARLTAQTLVTAEAALAQSGLALQVSARRFAPVPAEQPARLVA